ncbi:hypothetical protein HMPREF1548_01743 [Clostridium sp. KLE 1755]|nr:hypothetical protein HMPREF1548_01743 [Clostridium sp. KLE 1755]
MSTGKRAVCRAGYLKRDPVLFFRQRHENAGFTGMQPVGDKLQYADFL